MSQSGIIAGALLAAFIFWLAVNNRLQTYTGVLWGPTAAPKPTGGPGGVALPGPAGSAPGASSVTKLLPDAGAAFSPSGGGGGLLSDVGEIAGLLEFIP